MKLIVNCKNCREKIKLRNVANDRGQLSREIGDDFSLKCEACSKENRYHINEVKANESKYIALFASSIFIFGTGAIVYFLKEYIFKVSNHNDYLTLGGVMLIPLVVYLLLMKQERENTSRFNRYRV